MRFDLVALAILAIVFSFAWALHSEDRRSHKRWLAKVNGEFERSERRLDAEALAKYPTQQAVMAALVVVLPCGCTERWDLSPPAGMSCGKEHLSMNPGPMPIQAWRARDVLRRRGLWS